MYIVRLHTHSNSDLPYYIDVSYREKEVQAAEVRGDVFWLEFIYSRLEPYYGE